ncbi:hypothetical protein GLOTRDRAFT_139156 [Gloeophyllum trabeum ATCC 11539]|uniref:DUF6533 domain-containing protein n=1 Tax=Gloeophyllum trabeum (strain ATCC 11539 / FP-39264 / Madison 617) TaxID=670483 RepID=S7RJS4_GLOTA|nr:uncharacterized protein GLOTRDRAFT_139156 [Gloeophyllum trabeum ATCC 11539]EPQ54610.1 hypothetical protein GLOTRDRAFT_139156 [Gloeophyllum trabeum ATCC 11539]
MDTSTIDLVLADIQVVNYVNAAAFAWLAYDILLTLGDEVQTVWNSRWTLAKVLYLLLRYLIAITLMVNLVVDTRTDLTEKVCTQWMRFYAFDTVSIASWLGGALLSVRIWALYGCSRKILFVVCFLYLVETAAGIITASITLASEHSTPRLPGVPVHGCFLSLTPPKKDSLVIIGWTFHVGVNAIFFALTMYKFMRTVGAQGFSIFEAQTVAPLFQLFIYDGAFYFLVILASSLYNLVIMLALWNRPTVVVGEALLAATYAVTSSRLMLHLREYIGRHNAEVYTDVELETRPSRPALVLDTTITVPEGYNRDSDVIDSGISGISMSLSLSDKPLV